MKFFNRIRQILQKPYPEDESDAVFFRNAGMISLFVAAFLFIFRPFGLSTLQSGALQVCLGFGLVTFLTIVGYEFIIIRLFRSLEQRRQLTFGKWILDITAILLCISLANFLFIQSVMSEVHWAYFPEMLYSTVAIGVFPVVLMGGISLARSERKYQVIAAEIKQRARRSFGNSPQKNLSVFNVQLPQIRYVEALQNYVKIGHLNAEGTLVELTERATLKSVLERLEGSSMVRCHRSFLVNEANIVDVSGNAQGLLLTLADCEKLIPVSRSYVPVFKHDPS